MHPRHHVTIREQTCQRALLLGQFSIGWLIVAQEARLDANLALNDVNSRQQRLPFLDKLLSRPAVSERKSERMLNQELEQARRECRITLSKWNQDMRRLNGLLHDFDAGSVHSIRAGDSARVPEADPCFHGPAADPAPDVPWRDTSRRRRTERGSDSRRPLNTSWRVACCCFSRLQSSRSTKSRSGSRACHVRMLDMGKSSSHLARQRKARQINLGQATEHRARRASAIVRESNPLDSRERTPALGWPVVYHAYRLAAHYSSTALSRHSDVHSSETV